jgi:alpha-galactosidase
VAWLSVSAVWSAQTCRLEDLDLGQMTIGWGQPRSNLSVTQRPLSIGGQKFDRGVGTHAPSGWWIDLSGCARRLHARAGMDDAAANPAGTVRFKVIGDGRLLWQSTVMHPGDPAQPVAVDLTGVGMLTLVVGDGGDGNSYDHADWADAWIEYQGEAPKAVHPPRERAVILTPKPGPAPRINGARVFGVRPGSPFYFTIPATGDRPMRFGAEGLPRGLRIDADSGQITGSIDQAGVHAVTLSATNSLGEARRPLRIVCGDTLALTPHMGWNSWYVWENHVTDGIMRAAADAMVRNGMIQHGYMYVNIDDCWAIKPGSTDPELGGPPRDAQGRINSNQRFPDMSALTDYIHSLGLKAGIYTSPGPRTCAGFEGAYRHEEADARRFAEWGFDFLKYDWCSYGDLKKGDSVAAFQEPYRQISGILQRQSRDIVLNLCQYGMGDVWTWGREVGGNSWRTAGDLGLSFEGIATALFRDGFDVYANRQIWNHGGPGGWNDPDYLLLGYLSNWKGQTAPTPLTPNEQYTHVSLWALLAAPLIFSGDVTRVDEFTLSLLCNDEVIEVDQDPLGKTARRVRKDEELEVWVKELEDGSRAVGLFNRGEAEATVEASWADLGVTGSQRVRDLWRQQEVGIRTGPLVARVPRHGVVLVRLWKK